MADSYGAGILIFAFVMIFKKIKVLVNGCGEPWFKAIRIM